MFKLLTAGGGESSARDTGRGASDITAESSLKNMYKNYISVMRKQTMWFSKVRQKSGCTNTDDGYRLIILDLESRVIVLSL